MKEKCVSWANKDYKLSFVDQIINQTKQFSYSKNEKKIMHTK